MRLTWRDAVATVLTGLVVAGWAAYRAGTGLPLIAGARGMALFALVLGITACAVGGVDAFPQEPGAQRVVIGIASAAGAVALGAAVVTMITGSAATLAALVGITAVLWLVATVRHAVTARHAPPAGTPVAPTAHAIRHG